MKIAGLAARCRQKIKDGNLPPSTLQSVCILARREDFWSAEFIPLQGIGCFQRRSLLHRQAKSNIEAE